MTEDIDLSEIDKKYKDKCSLIKAGTCKNVNIFLQQSREKEKIEKELQSYKCQEKYPGQCRCAFRCLDNTFCDAAEKKIQQLKNALIDIKYLTKNLEQTKIPYCQISEQIRETIRKVGV